MDILKIKFPTAAVETIDVRLTRDEARLIRALTAFTPAAVANAFGVEYDLASRICTGLKNALNAVGFVECSSDSTCLVFLPRTGDVDEKGFAKQAATASIIVHHEGTRTAYTPVQASLRIHDLLVEREQMNGRIAQLEAAIDKIVLTAKHVGR
jgi:hypothetical protein